MFMEPYLLCSPVTVLLSRTVADGLMIGLLMSLDEAIDELIGLEGCIPGLVAVLPAVVPGLLAIPCFTLPLLPCIRLDEVPGLLLATEEALFAVAGLAVVLACEAVLLLPVAAFLIDVDGLAMVRAVVVLALDAVTFLATVGFLEEAVFLTELLFAVPFVGLADLLVALLALETVFFTELRLVPEADFLADVDLLTPDVVLDAEVVLPEAVLLVDDVVLLAEVDGLARLEAVVVGLDVPLLVLLMPELNVRAMDWPFCIASLVLVLMSSDIKSQCLSKMVKACCIKSSALWLF
ncbi:hypothetical protein GH742_04615 [Legionella sp. MW5194]|uniref:hypothetical protein n=1 Tax=Legionella sp. MW5194 TaxID=2662448 RepID=UPI00193C9721|nr:hypothetical protein [Legionella sp. MW5194]QRN03206.1 hypothetical protein GH742_04615 [Legionella sp. MW5194]